MLQLLERQNCQSLTVDLQEVSYVDTSGVAILMEALQSARAAGKAFQLKNLQQYARAGYLVLPPGKQSGLFMSRQALLRVDCCWPQSSSCHWRSVC